MILNTEKIKTALAETVLCFWGLRTAAMAIALCVLLFRACAGGMP